MKAAIQRQVARVQKNRAGQDSPRASHKTGADADLSLAERSGPDEQQRPINARNAGHVLTTSDQSPENNDENVEFASRSVKLSDFGPPFGSTHTAAPTAFHGTNNPEFTSATVPGTNLNPDSLKLIQEGNLLPRRDDGKASPPRDEAGSPLLLKVMSVLMDAKRKDVAQRTKDAAVVQASECVAMLVKAGGWGEDAPMAAREVQCSSAFWSWS